MPSRSVVVTYTCHPPSSQLLTSAIKGIRSQLPLRNLHWKPSTRTSLRTIQELDVTLVELGEAGSFGKEPSGSVLESPLVNLCLVTCENDDVYKTQTRSFIRDWLSLLAAKKSSYVPLIVLVNPSTSTASGKNVFGRDKGVYGKLKTDFNLNKKERCVQLNLPAEGTSDPAAWPEVLNKLKESIVSAFDNAIVDREEEVKRGESQRLTVGWNFCTWFLLKESLAYSFEGVNLFEDALIVYEELEASFFQVLKEQNLSWFGKLGATGAQDDSIPILDTGAKPYREMLQTSLISIFDFRVYVFARQAQLLGKIGRITEIAKRGQWFVASLARRLRENEGDLAKHFIESWTYSTCMNIVQKGDEWSRIDRPNGDYSGLIAYESARSELLDIARVQVERIGVASAHLPNEYPFAPPSGLTYVSDDVLFESSDNGAQDDEPQAERSTLSNSQLAEAMRDQRSFREMYQHLTRKAVSAYEACGKNNSVIRLKADLAALAMDVLVIRLDENWRLAYELCRRLAKDCADLEVWEPVAEYALDGALRAHEMLEIQRDEDWAALSLAYLRACALISNREEGQERFPGSTRVLEDLRKSKIEVSALEHPGFTVRIQSDASTSEEQDLSRLTVEVTNLLPCSAMLSSVHIDLQSHQGEQVSFSTTGIEVRPGTNQVDLTCPTSCHGIFNVHGARLYLGSVEMQYLRDSQDLAIQMKRSIHGPKVELRLPHDMSLDEEQKIIVEIRVGNPALGEARLAVEPYAQDTTFDWEHAGCSSRTIKPANGIIELGDIEESLSVSIPFHTESQHDSIQARIYLDYKSTDGDRSEWIDTQTIRTGLPLTVNVQDFFRPDCLISAFTIASDGQRHLRIGSVELLSANAAGIEVVNASAAPSGKVERNAVVVSPLQPLSCLFKVLHDKSVVEKEHATVLRLAIKYTCIDEDAAFRSLVNTALDQHKADAPLRRIVSSILEEPSLWLQQYLVLGSAADTLDSVLRSMPQTVQGSFSSEATQSLVEEIRELEKRQTDWRRLEIPVELPRRRLLTTVHIDHVTPNGDRRVYEGRAVSMKITLTTSFAWLDQREREKEMKAVFDIQVNGDDWILLGKKKGFYTIHPDRMEEQDIVLVPVRSGHLSLPHVQVLLLPDENGQDSGDEGSALVCETYVDNAAEGIEVLPAKSTAMAVINV